MNQQSLKWWIYAEVPSTPHFNQKKPALAAWTKVGEERKMLSRILKNPVQLLLFFQLLKADPNLYEFPTWDARGGWGRDGAHDRNGGEQVCVLAGACK